MAGSNDSNVRVKVTSQFDSTGITQAEREFRRAYQQQARAEAEMTRAMQQQAAARNAAIKTTANTIGVLGIALTAAAAAVVNTAANFDQAMSNVAATGVDRLGDLRQAALEAGRDTAYSASEAAFGVEQLAKAGLGAGDIIGGGLTAALNLASASGLDVARASEITAVTLKQFGLQGKDASHVADLLAAGANKAVGGVDELSQALEYVGPVAAQMGVSVEETTGTLALFAEQGILGQKAGTGLRGVIMALTAPSAAAADEMKTLNMSLFDGRGKFIGLTGVAGQLHDKLSGLTEAERSEALGRIFGNEQITAARILYQAGAEDVRKWTGAVSQSGYAQEMAAKKLDNLKGDLEILRGSVETVMITMGDGAQGPLRSMVQAITGVVNGISEMPPASQTALLGLIGGAGLITLGLAGAMRLTVGLGEVKTALQTLEISGKTAGLAVAGITAGLAVAGLGIAAWADAQAKAQQRVEALRQSLDAATGAVTGLTRETVAAQLVKTPDWWTFDFSGSAADGAQKLGINLDTLTDAILGNAQAWDEVVNVVGDSAYPDDITARAKAAGLSIGDYNHAVMAVRRELQGNAADLDEARKRQEQMNEATDAAKEPTDAYSGALETQASAADEAATSLDDLAKALDAVNAPALDASNAAIRFQAAIDDASAALEKNKATLDLDTEAGRANQTALNDLAKAGADQANAVLKQTGSVDQFRASLDASRQQLFDQAKAFGMTDEQAQTYIDSVLAIPSSAVTTAMLDTQRAQQQLEGWIAALSARVATINVRANLPDLNGRASGNGRMGTSYAGNLFEFHAAGALRPAAHVAQIAPAQSWRVFGDRADVPEAYIPINNAVRSHRILQETAARMGYQVGGGQSAAFPETVTLVDADGSILARARVITDQRLGEVAQQIPQQQRLRRGVRR